MTPHHKQVSPLPSLRRPISRNDADPLAFPFSRQVMMFSATLGKEVRLTCKKFMQNVSRPFRSRPSSCLVSLTEPVFCVP